MVLNRDPIFKYTKKDCQIGLIYSDLMITHFTLKKSRCYEKDSGRNMMKRAVSN